MSNRSLALLLAERDDSTKADVIEVILDALAEVDELDPSDFGRIVRVCPTLDAALFAVLSAMKEKNAELLESDADWEKNVAELETELREARERLQEKESPTRREEEQARIISDLQTRLQAAEARLEATALVIDDYSDMLALARRFVSTAEQAGIKARHVRAKKVRT